MNENQPTSDPGEVLISLNPSAGARSGVPVVESLVAELAARDIPATVISDIEELVRRSQQLHGDGRLRAVVAAGGDGTVALVVNRLEMGVPIAVLPLGTENLLAKFLGMRADPVLLGDAIATGRTQTLDAGEANGRIFLLMLGCGFDAEVVRRLHSERSGHIHHFSYAKPILDSIRSYRYPAIRVQILSDGSDSPEPAEPGNEAIVSEEPSRRRRGRSSGAKSLVVRWAFVVNIPRYARGLMIAPDAAGDDGLLDVCTFRQGSLWNGLRYLGGILLRQHRTWRDFGAAQCRRLRLESDEPVPYQLDGDPGGRLPVEIRVLPGRLTMIVPADAEFDAEPVQEKRHADDSAAE